MLEWHDYTTKDLNGFRVCINEVFKIRHALKLKARNDEKLSKEVILCINQGEATSFTLNTDSGFVKIFIKGEKNRNFRVSIRSTSKLNTLALSEFLKYGFCNKSVWKDEPLTSWTLFSTYLSWLLGGFAGCNIKPAQKWWQICWKNWSEVHLSEMTCYRIHTLREARETSMQRFQIST